MRAISIAEDAMEHGFEMNTSASLGMMLGVRSPLATALYMAGRSDESERQFRKIEKMLKKSAAIQKILFSEPGFMYCELLISKGHWIPARNRANKTIAWARADGFLRDIGLDTLTLARANLLRIFSGMRSYATEPAPDKSVSNVIAQFNYAIDHLRGAGTIERIPVGLLARAAFRRSIGDWNDTVRDLDEVEEIAEPGPMRLHLCDMALERARLAFAQIEAFAPLNGMLENGNPEKPKMLDVAKIMQLKDEAAKQLAIAADYIESCGYHRRDEERDELQAVLRGEKKFADLLPRV